MMLKRHTHSTPWDCVTISMRRSAWGAAAKPLVCTKVERTPVQILVVVANIPVRNLKTEVEQAFVNVAKDRRVSGAVQIMEHYAA